MKPCPIGPSGEFLFPGSHDGMEHWRADAAGVVGEINAKLTSVQKYEQGTKMVGGKLGSFCPRKRNSCSVNLIFKVAVHKNLGVKLTCFPFCGMPGGTW